MDESINPENKASSDEQSQEALKVIQAVEIINPKLFQRLNREEVQEIVKGVISITQVKSHSGPLPDPEDIIKYDSVIPNGADRMMVMAEKSQLMAEKEQDFKHRRVENLDKRKLNQSGLGQIFGFIISVLVIGGGIYLLSIGQSIAGFAAIITPIAGIIAAFVYTKNSELKD
ncbi:DUF2335 domain-containing protein [uncultured Mucilaginibacter sp.]|uniref:DUF2335 domain-containing protein n=1 Tax=uncultured Mucilaginibacter sp. TaxID=797541 RepID=UPI00260B418E|nr:DUF2335 domain-containing protein [uncultured Mucilaginibacter sp.]